MAISTPFRKKQKELVEIQSFENLWMQLGIFYHSLDFQGFFAQTSTLIVILLNVIFLIIKFYQNDIENQALKVKGRVILEDSLFLSSLEAVEFILILISIFNTILLFNQKKRVVLFNQPTQVRNHLF